MKAWEIIAMKWIDKKQQDRIDNMEGIEDLIKEKKELEEIIEQRKEITKDGGTLYIEPSTWDVIQRIKLLEKMIKDNINSLSIQIGGNHYKDMQMQPVELIAKLKLNYFQGNIVKYISRDKDNKIEDLEKAKHYCELAIELDKEIYKKTNNFLKLFTQELTNKEIAQIIINYCLSNLMLKNEPYIISSAYKKDYAEAIKQIDEVLSNERYKQRLDEELSKIIDKKATKGGIEIIALDNKGIPEELKEEIIIITKDYLDHGKE